MPNKEKWNELIQAMLRPQKLLGANVRGGGGGGQEDESISSCIPGYKSVDVEGDPPLAPAEPLWVQEAKQTTMRDGSRGWSSFLVS